VSFQLHPDARDELREAVLFYDRAAERFVNAFETAIAAIILKPDRFREFESESRVKAIMRESLLEGLRSHKAKSPELKATMVSWAITGAALQWSGERETSTDELADAVLPTVHTALQAGE
jgi:hypothetical protein